MGRLQNAVAVAVDNRALALGIAAPQQEYDAFTLFIDNLDDPVGEALPALPLVRSRARSFHGQHAVQQQDPLVGPGGEVAVGGYRQPQFSVQFLVDILQ